MAYHLMFLSNRSDRKSDTVKLNKSLCVAADINKAIPQKKGCSDDV